MKKEYLYALAAITIIAVVAFLMIGRNQTPVTPSPANNSQVNEENTVVYGDSGYSPNELRVKVGATVTFVNQSDLPMWTASDPHPVHTDYAEFNHRHGVGKGGAYTFTFEEARTYKYHNHLSPSIPEQ